LAAYFFEHSADIIPNHVLQVPDPNVTIAARCEPMPIEFVVRGYLVGHAWRVYRDGGRLLCGVRLPEGLVENVAFPGPILTPTTKAAEGHDEDISAADIVDRGILDSETFEYLRAMSLALFRRGSEMAEAQGLILVDTKYEFGRRADGTLVVIDEIHTPDSSRYFYADGYEERLAAGQPPRQLSKEFVREWLMEHGFMGREGQHLPDLPDDFRVNVSERYVELFESVTGSEFVPDTNPAPQERILTALGSTIVR